MNVSNIQPEPDSLKDDDDFESVDEDNEEDNVDNSTPIKTQFSEMPPDASVQSSPKVNLFSSSVSDHALPSPDLSVQVPPQARSIAFDEAENVLNDTLLNVSALTPSATKKISVVQKTNHELSLMKNEAKKAYDKLVKKLKNSKNLFGINPKNGYILFQSGNTKFSYSANVWVKIMEYLFSDTLSQQPQFGKKRKPSAVKHIAELLFSQQIVSKHQFQSFPNLAHTFEADESLAKKTTPSSAKFGIEVAKHLLGKKRKIPSISPKHAKKLKVQGHSNASSISTVDGSGVKVNFKKWNDDLLF